MAADWRRSAPSVRNGGRQQCSSATIGESVQGVLLLTRFIRCLASSLARWLGQRQQIAACMHMVALGLLPLPSLAAARRLMSDVCDSYNSGDPSARFICVLYLL